MSACCNIESPFEFRALEVALEAICSFLAARTTELETAAYPALDELTSKVGTSSFIFTSDMIFNCILRSTCRLVAAIWIEFES